MACNQCNNCPVGGNFGIPAGEFASGMYMRFDELEQGKFADCWFVAALSSLLFVQKRKAPENKDGKYGFIFGSSTINTSGKVCLEGAGIYGAKAIDGLTTYSWPGGYEKAYGAFLENANNPPDPPEMQKYIDNSDGDAISCLLDLKGGKPYPFLTSDYTDGSGIFSKIQQRTNYIGAYSRSVNAPYVAFKPKTIVEGHSFSVLGLYQNGATQYIILRDPHPAQASGPAVTWTYRDNVTGMLTKVKCPDKGIFAITPTDFKDSFYGFGYVY